MVACRREVWRCVLPSLPRALKPVLAANKRPTESIVSRGGVRRENNWIASCQEFKQNNMTRNLEAAYVSSENIFSCREHWPESQSVFQFLYSYSIKCEFQKGSAKFFNWLAGVSA